MERYRPPSRGKIAEYLKRAGADVNGQTGGSQWILLALKGVGIAKLESKDLQHLRDAKKKLDQAMAELSAMGHPFVSELPADFPMHRDEPKRPLGWLNPDVIEPVARAAWHLDFCITSYRPGSSQKHRQFWEALHGYFVVNNLAVNFGRESPIIAIFAECIGLSQESALKSISRIRNGQK